MQAVRRTGQTVYDFLVPCSWITSAGLTTAQKTPARVTNTVVRMCWLIYKLICFGWKIYGPFLAMQSSASVRLAIHIHSDNWVAS